MRASSVKMSAGSFEPALLIEELDLFFAEPVDVEGAAGDEMLEVLDGLIGAGEFAAAARDGAFLACRRFLAHHVGVQMTRAFLRKFVGLGAARAVFHNDAQHLRNDVAGALDAHRIADADVEPRDLVEIMQRRVLDHDAADRHRFELGHRRERAGAADLDLDVLDDGQRLLGGKFVRDRPARRARHEAETLLPVEAVDLVDDAVDVVIERGALRFDLAVERQQFLDRAADFGQRIGLEAARCEPFDHAGLRVRRHLAHLAPGIGEEAERARRGDRRILLPQRAGGGIARIGEYLAAGFGLALVEREEGVLGHIDFAAHLAHRRHPFALETVRDVLERFHIGGDVLALGAVAARRPGDEFAVFVAQRHRQAVDLRFGVEDDLVVLGEPQEAADAADEIDHVFVGERIVEGEHRYGVPHLGEARRRRRADPLGQAFQRPQLREPRLDRRITLAQRVVGRIRNGRRVVLIIAPVVPGDLGREPCMLGFGLALGEGVDGRFVLIAAWHDRR